MVICLELGAVLHMVQLMPLQLTVSCFSKIQIGFTFLVLAHPGSPGQRAVKWLSVCVCVFFVVGDYSRNLNDMIHYSNVLSKAAASQLNLPYRTNN